MKLRAIATIFLGLSAIPLQAAPTTMPSFVAQHGRLAVKGTHVVDMHGEPVILRGMSLYWSQWKGQFYNPDAIAWLHNDWHCTIVRAAMAVSDYVKNPDAEEQKIETVVQAAVDQGIYVIIDWHTDRDNHQPLAETFFEKMATKYSDTPNVIFEIWNEPLNRADWSTVIKPYAEAIIPRIRAHSQNLIVCGTQTWSQEVDKASRDPLHFENVAYTLHFYSSTHRQWLRDKATTALKNGIALFVTEWGASEASGNGKLDAIEARKWLDFLNDNQISWCMWSVADLSETSAALRPGANPKGGWTEGEISPSGMLGRTELIATNP